jgi:CelD/BcsL family acetyltransferase involved in cellulose biosynthesis
LHIVVVKVDGRVIAIAPLMVTPVRMWGIKVRRLGFLYNEHVPRSGFLIAERPAEVYRAIWDHLSRETCWDVLQLCQLVEGCPTLKEVSKAAVMDGCAVGLWPSEASPYIPLDSSWTEYFEGLATKHRSNLRNRFKRLKAMGPVEEETVTTRAGLQEALEDGLRLEAAAWKGDARTAISSDPDIARFYSMLASRAADRGWMRLHFLQADSRRVAFDFSLVYKNRIHLLKLGYDPAYSRFSPSNLLLCLLLEKAFGQRIAEYDFLGATADWKVCWAKHVRQHYWLFVFRGTLKGQFLHAVKFRFVPLLKQMGLGHARRFVAGALGTWTRRRFRREA